LRKYCAFFLLSDFIVQYIRMPLPQRCIARCFDPTQRWAGRLSAALRPAQWNIVRVDALDQLIPADGSPALLLWVMPEDSAAAARWWSQQRARASSRSPLIVVASHVDDACIAYWQELGAAAVLTTTLELPLVLQLAQRFTANRDNLAADPEHPLTPFWQALPWADALPKSRAAG